MARIAKLHDGSQLEFPDETDDATMDSHVAQHLQSMHPSAPSPVAEIVEELLTGMAQSRQSRTDASISKKEELQLQTDLGRAKIENMAKAGAHVATSIEEGLSLVADQLVGLPSLVEAINKLSETVQSAAEEICRTLMMPNYVKRDSSNEIEMVGRLGPAKKKGVKPYAN